MRLPSHIEAGLPGAGLGVEAGVDNGGIGLAGAGADVSLRSHHTDAAAAAAQLPCDGAADDAAADDQYIAMIHLSFLKTKATQKAPGVSSGQFCMAQHLTA